MQSTPLMAFDQHAATTVAAVLLPGQRTPAFHTLSSDSPTIVRFVRASRATSARCGDATRRAPVASSCSGPLRLRAFPAR
jgi:hypothetical protein